MAILLCHLSCCILCWENSEKEEKKGTQASCEEKLDIAVAGSEQAGKSELPLPRLPET